MQKRIYTGFLVVTLLCVLLLAISFSQLFLSAARTQEMDFIRNKAYLMAELFNQDIDYMPIGAIRVTVIAPDGLVIMDSHALADLMDSRADRTEVIAALENGSGEAIRYSGVLDGATFYYAIRLENGNVLRLSRTLNSLGAVFTTILPALIVGMILVLIFAYVITRILMRKIFSPLATINLDDVHDIHIGHQSDDFYEELFPFLNKISHQKQEIKRQMAALKSRNATIDAIITNMQEGLILIDSNSLILTVNNSALKIFGIQHEEDIIHKNVQHIYRDDAFSLAVEQCLKGHHMDFTLLRNDNIYDIYLNPVYSGGSHRGAILLFVDKTEQHKAENLRREFSANVSHELKTPLTTISALSEMMVNGMAKTEDFVDFARKISVQTHRLIRIIEDIIRLSQFDENKFERHLAAFDLYALAESVISALQGQAAEKNIALKLVGEPLQITANIQLIDELLYNLIENSIKYNKDGGSVTVDLTPEDDWCKITVSDTGIGIPPEHQSRIFERFYRVDSSRSKRTGGTGLGLSIVKHITEHHNGKIAIDSTEGVGTSIMCYIKM